MVEVASKTGKPAFAVDIATKLANISNFKFLIDIIVYP